jgi:Ca2+-binding EF-hand superfamily protein
MCAGGGVSDGGEDAVGRGAQQQQQRIVHESLPFSKAYVPSERSQLAAKQASYNRATTKVPPCILRADKLTFTVAGGRERQMMDLQSAMSKRQQEHENKALLAVFARMSATGTRLDENDIARALISLGHPFTAQEVQKMLWEVDDDACGYLTPEAFQAMYYRVRASTERDEPRGLFRLIEFMMIDADGSGSIDIDEAMTIFRTRFGKGAVDSVISVFAERATREGIAIEFAKISYSDFVKSSNLIVLY